MKENRYLAMILLVLFISVAAIIFMARRINKPVAALKEFMEVLQKGELDKREIKFPKDELGDMGEKIMKAFTQMEENKRLQTGAHPQCSTRTQNSCNWNKGLS